MYHARGKVSNFLLDKIVGGNYSNEDFERTREPLLVFVYIFVQWEVESLGAWDLGVISLWSTSLIDNARFSFSG